MKMKHLKMYAIDKIPDHIKHEVEMLTQSMLQSISDCCKDYHSNIGLAAMELSHVVYLKTIVVNEEKALMEAAQNSAIAIIKNMECLIEIDKKKKTISEKDLSQDYGYDG